MYITGYHGTSNSAANAIANTGEFRVSHGDKQWLGDGIYFYCSFEMALNWQYKESDPFPEAVIHALIRVDESEVFDADSPEGVRVCKAISDYICKSAHVTSSRAHAEKNQCKIMNMIWETNPEIKVIACSLPDEPTRLLSLMDLRKKHREFCIRNNKSIAYIHVIQRGDINE